MVYIGGSCLWWYILKWLGLEAVIHSSNVFWKTRNTPVNFLGMISDKMQGTTETEILLLVIVIRSMNFSSWKFIL